VSQHASDQALISEAVPRNGPRSLDPMIPTVEATGFVQGAVHA
jgi:hypothetical protein